MSLSIQVIVRRTFRRTCLWIRRKRKDEESTRYVVGIFEISLFVYIIYTHTQQACNGCDLSMKFLSSTDKTFISSIFTHFLRFSLSFFSYHTRIDDFFVFTVFLFVYYTRINHFFVYCTRINDSFVFTLFLRVSHKNHTFLPVSHKNQRVLCFYCLSSCIT